MKRFDGSPGAVWRAYEHGQDYKRSIGLYEQVKKNEDFVQGRQWEGLRVNTLDPLIFNVLRRCVNLFVSMMVSDDVAVSAAPFARDTESDRTQRVLEQAFESAMERSKVKDLNRLALRNACVDGDGCFYLHFDPGMETGQDAKGDIRVECIDNTNVYFGNTASDEVERQPYIILAMRRDVDEVRAEARANRRPGADVNAIRPDGEGEGMVPEEKERRVTVLLHMRKTPGGVAFQKTTRHATVMGEKVLPYTRYPVAFLSWDRRKNCCHGVSPVTEAIPNQIAINKLYSMYVQCIKQVAFPKIIYDMTRFPNGYSSEIGKAVGMRGNPNQAVLSAFKAPDISGQVPNGQVYANFIAAYPEVQPGDIPQEVWQDAQTEGSLVSAYRKYEIALLRARLRALEQNAHNERQAVGSAAGDGQPVQLDPVAAALRGEM